MERKGRQGPRDKADEREARLKAALKSNLARRKAQAKARAAEPDPADHDKQTPGNED